MDLGTRVLVPACSERVLASDAVKCPVPKTPDSRASQPHFQGPFYSTNILSHAALAVIQLISCMGNLWRCGEAYTVRVVEWLGPKARVV